MRNTLFASLALTFLLAGCAAETAGEAPVDSATEALASPSDATTYARLERIGTNVVVSRVNGGKLRCPRGGSVARCTVDELVLPADCGWECRDGVLSLRGVTVLRGAFVSTRGHTSFVAAAAFDTADATLGRHDVYRVTRRAGRITAVAVGSSASARPVGNVDFSQAHDASYALDPARGFIQMDRTEGLLVTGRVSRGSFVVDRAFRQWSPEADCDVAAAARAHAFPRPAEDGELFLELATTAEAEAYQDPQHRSVRWLVRTEIQGAQSAYTWGWNDLWAETFVVSATTCAVTTTGEH